MAWQRCALVSGRELRRLLRDCRSAIMLFNFFHLYSENPARADKSAPTDSWISLLKGIIAPLVVLFTQLPLHQQPTCTPPPTQALSHNPEFLMAQSSASRWPPNQGQ